ncbi:MAG: S24/S26 family peptidase [Rikenellaceae bacterium]|nr:S24/S26 family peptidase [Rikenellaceae bacterium]
MNALVKNGELLPLIEESIRNGKSVTLTVRGNSMQPRLRDGKDVVELHPFSPDDIKVGDVILFRYGNRFILHRIIHIDRTDKIDPLLITKGDALKTTEKITMSAVVALAALPLRSRFSFFYDIRYYIKRALAKIKDRLK